MTREEKWVPPVLNPLPLEVAFVKRYRSGRVLVSCGHPPDRRLITINGGDLCGLCKGDDYDRQCFLLADVPDEAIVPIQAGLF